MKLVLWRPWCRHMRDDIAISSWHWEPFAHEFISIDAHRSSLGTNSFVYEWMKYSESDATKDSFLSIQLESRPSDFLSILSCTLLSHVGGCSAWGTVFRSFESTTPPSQVDFRVVSMWVPRFATCSSSFTLCINRPRPDCLWRCACLCEKILG